MSDEVRQRFGFVDEKLNDLKADVLEIRKGVSDIQSNVNSLMSVQAIHAKILEQQHEQLKEHIRRTNLLEDRVEQVSDEFRRELKPIENHVLFVNKAIKGIILFFGVLATIATIIKTFIR